MKRRLAPVIALMAIVSGASSPAAGQARLNVVATTEDERRAWQRRGVLFHDTYVGAALHAFRAGLLDADGARRVALSARTELEAVPFDDPRLAEARRAELDRDVALLELELSR